jgi:hypothetical protein
MCVVPSAGRTKCAIYAAPLVCGVLGEEVRIIFVHGLDTFNDDTLLLRKHWHKFRLDLIRCLASPIYLHIHRSIDDVGAACCLVTPL